MTSATKLTSCMRAERFGGRVWDRRSVSWNLNERNCWKGLKRWKQRDSLVLMRLLIHLLIRRFPPLILHKALSCRKSTDLKLNTALSSKTSANYHNDQASITTTKNLRHSRLISIVCRDMYNTSNTPSANLRHDRRRNWKRGRGFSKLIEWVWQNSKPS